MSAYERAVDAVATDVAAPHADRVDREGTMPDAAVDALRAAGLLGLISGKDVGGMGETARAAALVVERLARECASTAMVICMHYAATAVIEAHGAVQVRRALAAGEHLATLAFSESGSRSHFWAPLGTAVRESGAIRLDGQKSWVTSASRATLYVWSARAVAREDACTLWLVPRATPGLEIRGSFDGLGLRGNDSTPITAKAAVIPESARLGDDGQGLDIMLGTVLPIFNAMTAGCAVGLMEGATAATSAHVAATSHRHLGTTLADLPTIRAYVARMRIATDQARCLLLDTLTALEQSRPDAMLRVLECKAAAGEAATQVLDLAMRVCGGAAFRREVGVERRFRDARAGTVMAPTTDQLYDFIGKAVCGLPLF
jgi:alkylation response protein AidB-like acyl-CoA dehydrogenase